MDFFNRFYQTDRSFFESKNCIHTATEIAHQMLAWRELCEILRSKKNEANDFFSRLGNLKEYRIILTGAGSSGFTGEAAVFSINKSAGLNCEAIHTTDIVSAPHSVLADKPTLLVSFARSGYSPESMGAVICARNIIKNLYELSFVCDGASALCRLTGESPRGLSIVMPERTLDKAFAMTSSVSAMLLACFALFNIDKLDSIISDIGLLADSVEMQGLAEKAKTWAAKNYDRLVVIGSGCNKGLAREAALKTLELSSGTVCSSAESALAFRHGPKSIINRNTLTVHFISNDPLTYKYDLDLLAEICSESAGNRVIALSAKEIPFKTDENISIPALNYSYAGDLCCGINFLVFAQLLAMFKSINLNIPTDNPSVSGKLSRVVKGVTLYEMDRI